MTHTSFVSRGSDRSPASISRPKISTALSSVAVGTLVHSIMLASSASSAAAQATPQAKDSEPAKLDAVTVQDSKAKTHSSPKFTEPLRDTPQTVVVIPSEVYLQQGAASLSDVLRNTSGITFAAGEGGSATATSGDSFYMRGFDTSNNIFVDGVRDVGAYSRDVFNLEQI